jgi:WD40 repeat protein
MKYNFFTSAENKIFASSKDGKVLYWNSKNSINKPVMIAQKKSNILALSYSKSTKEIIYSEKGTIFFQKQDPNKKDDLFSVKREISIDPSHVRVLEMIEDNKYCYLVVGNEKGNLYKIDLKAKDGILVAEKLNYDAKGIRGGFHCADYNASKDKLVLGTGKGELLFFTLSPSDMLTTGTKLLFPKTISNISEGIVIDLAFSSKGDLLAIAHFSGQITLSKLPQSEDDLQILLSFNNKKKVFAVNFSPDDNYLFFSDEEKLRVCPTDSKILYQKLFLQKDLFLDKEKTTLDKDEWKKYISIEFPQEKCKIKQE